MVEMPGYKTHRAVTKRLQALREMFEKYIKDKRMVIGGRRPKNLISGIFIVESYAYRDFSCNLLTSCRYHATIKIQL